MPRLIVTAGPTREFIDPVRFLSNRSTGKMGYAVAQAAVDAGWAVTLISGPVALEPPQGLAKVIRVTTALEMLAALEAELAANDALVMCAAVADFRPEHTATRKMHKGELGDSLRLVPNPDILKTIAPRKGERVFAGFAAETGDPEQSATGKLYAKGLDLIVANDVTREGAGFAVDTNIVTILAPGEPAQRLPLLSKLEVAAHIIKRVETLVQRRLAPKAD